MTMRNSSQRFHSLEVVKYKMNGKRTLCKTLSKVQEKDRGNVTHALIENICTKHYHWKELNPCFAHSRPSVQRTKN